MDTCERFGLPRFQRPEDKDRGVIEQIIALRVQEMVGIYSTNQPRIDND